MSLTRIRLNRPQSRAWRAVQPGRTITLALGRGVGKSWFIRRICYLLISQWDGVPRDAAGAVLRGIRIVFLLPTFKQFRDVHSHAMLEELASDFAALGAKVDRTTFTVTFPGGSLIRVFPASDHGSKRALGIRADLVVIDEADDVDPDVFHTVVTPWFSEPWSLRMRVLSGTPRRARHGLLWKLFDAGQRGERIRSGQTSEFTEEEAEAATRFFSFHATYEDAPENVDQREVSAARLTMPEATFKREWLCDFDAGEGLIYPFEVDFHVRTPPPHKTFREFHVGMDHGWVDPGVLLLIGIQGHGNDATAWVLDEWYESECPNHVWNERAGQWSFARFWPDPSRPDRIADLRRMGLNVGETDNNIFGGIARVADLMFRRKLEHGEDWCRLYVAPQCKNLIREFGLYRRKKLPDGTFDEQPEDKNDHAPDALRYALTGRFGRGENTRHVTSGR